MMDTPLIDLIRARRANVAVIGQGYIGLPLAVEFAGAGFSVIGLESDLDRVGALGLGRSYIADVESARLGELLREGRYTPAAATTNEMSVILRLPEGRGNADHDRITPGKRCGVRRGGVATLAEEVPKARALDVGDVRTPEGQCADPVEVTLEPDHRESGTGELHGERQADVSLADDGHVRAPSPDQIDERSVHHLRSSASRGVSSSGRRISMVILAVP